MPLSRRSLWDFCKTALLGGMAVLLPIAIVSYFLHWLYRAGSGLIQPLTELLIARSRLQAALADVLVTLGIIGFCFLLGLLLRTRLGRWSHGQLETWLFARVPGYQLVKDTVGQFIGQGKASPFKGVCLAQPYGGGTWVTGLITAMHEDGRITVYVPNAPLPTTGLIFHLLPEAVQVLEGVSVDQAMRSIMACGAGSERLLTQHGDSRRAS